SKPRLCGCGRFGCLEAYASATAIVKRAQEALESDEQSALHKAVQKNGELSAKDVFDVAAAGDALAQQLVDQTAFYLAVGSTNMLHSIDPDIVLFAGGMTAAGPDFLEKIQKYVRELAFPVPAEKAQIRYAELGNQAGYIGAAGCGRLVYHQQNAK